MGTIKSLLEAVDTPGGHIVVLMCILGMLMWSGNQDAKQFVQPAFDVLLYAMKGNGSVKV